MKKFLFVFAVLGVFLLIFCCSKSGSGRSEEAAGQTNAVPLLNKEEIKTVEIIKPKRQRKNPAANNKIKNVSVKKIEKPAEKENRVSSRKDERNVSSTSVPAASLGESNQVIMKDGEYFIKFYQRNKTNVWIKKDLSNSPAQTGEKQEGLVGEEGNVIYQKVTQ